MKVRNLKILIDFKIVYCSFCSFPRNQKFPASNEIGIEFSATFITFMLTQKFQHWKIKQVIFTTYLSTGQNVSKNFGPLTYLVQLLLYIRIFSDKLETGNEFLNLQSEDEKTIRQIEKTKRIGIIIFKRRFERSRIQSS